MDRDCNRCVYSTREGGCRKFKCEGTKTVENIRLEVIDEFESAMHDLIVSCGNFVATGEVKIIAEQLKEKT